MADDLQIVIGAQVGGLISGIEAAQQQLVGLQATATAFASSLGGLNQSLAGITTQLNQGTQAHQQHAAAVQAHGTVYQIFQNAVAAIGSAFSGFMNTLTGAAGAHQQHAAAVHQHSSAMHTLLSPVHEVTHAFEHLIGLLGVGWGAHELIHQFHALAEQAEHMENISASIGMSPKDFAALSGAIQIATGDADLAARTFQTLERNARNALNDPFSTQGRAAEGLGLITGQLQAGLKNPNALIETLVEAYQKNVITAINPGEGIANFKDFVGRDIDSLTPIFARGLEHFRELKREALDLTGWTDKSIADLAHTAEAMNRIPLAFTGLKKQIYEQFRDPILETINDIKKALQDGGGVIEFLKDVGAIFKFLKENAPDLGAGTKREFSGIGDAITKGKDFDTWLRGQTWGSLLGKIGIGGVSGTTEDIARQRDVEEAGGTTPMSSEAGARSGKASWFGPWPGHPEWADAMNAGMPNASGASMSTPGIALYDKSTLGKWFVVSGPDGKQFVLPQVDVGPAPWTGKTIDINAPAAAQMGYTPKTFPTGAQFTYRPATAEEQAEASGHGTAATAHASDAADHAHAEVEKTNTADRAVNYGKLKQDLDENIKAIEARRDALLKYYDVEIKGARDNAKDVATLEAEKDAVIKKSIAEDLAARQAAIAKAGQGAGGELFRTQTMAGVDDKATQKLEELQLQALGREQQAQDKVRDAAISADENQRRIADQEEQTLLRSVQNRLQLQQLTVDQAVAAELKIVDDHKAAVDRILDDERRLAGESVKINQDVDNRKKEADQKYADERTKILEESQKRAHDVDQEIARDASSSLVDMAWGKSTFSDALASMMQKFEKRALEDLLTGSLDALGIGSDLDKSGLGTLFGSGGRGSSRGGIFSSIFGGLGSLFGSGSSSGDQDFSGEVGGGGGILGGIFSGVTTALKFLPFFFLQGGIVPSAAGGWQVPNVGSGSILAQLHSNEMVLPSGISSFIQSAAAGGGRANPVNFAYSPTINAPETPNMKQLLSRHGNDMLSWMQSQFRSGALKVPA